MSNTANSPLANRRVLVTGASSGIGTATAEAITRAGGRVALLARSAGALEELAGSLTGAVAVPGDVTDPDSVASAVSRAATEMGGLDGLVNSAGVVRPGDISTADPADWRLTFEVNVLGLLNVTAATLRWLRTEPLADVVNISSMSGRRRASTAMTVYSASKHAVHVISDGLREELSGSGVRVSTISPGFVRTPIFSGVDDQEVRDRYQEALRDKGLDPETVAAQIVHCLAQPEGVDLLEVAMVSTNQ